MLEWYQVVNEGEIDSPALLVYPERVEENIELAIRMAGSPDRLRPHVKTHKMAEICRMMISHGITRFKCATIAEAEMLAIAGAEDVLLAYQPVGPKIERFIALTTHYPETTFACLADNEKIAIDLNEAAGNKGIVLNIFLDLNVGMNRTGIIPQKAVEVVKHIWGMEHLQLKGIHSYDGHIHHTEILRRQNEADIAYVATESLYYEVNHLFPYPLTIVMGGTPTFPMHMHRKNGEFSPGTFVLWDWGYSNMLPDLPFKPAGLVLTRVISVIDKYHICVDLGYKSVGSESPLPRVHFLNATEAVPVSHSEEHLVLEVPDSLIYPLGTVLYGIPIHICPTVALYEKAYVIRENRMQEIWEVIARNRTINI